MYRVFATELDKTWQCLGFGATPVEDALEVLAIVRGVDRTWFRPGEVQDKADEELVNVFLPTTPNPTSGFLLFVPARDVIELEMGVEDAAKLVISAGLVYPDRNGEDAENVTRLRNRLDA